jgi:polysaccharide export outer membrane protein
MRAYYKGEIAMNGLFKKLFFCFVIVGSIVGLSTSAHGQNLDVLSGETHEQAVSQGDSQENAAKQAATQSTTLQKIEAQPAAVPQVNEKPTAEQPVEEKQVKVDPLSDENLKDVVASTKQQIELTADEASRYTLGPTDIIDIVVMRHPEVSGKYEINMEGKIQYEFIGDIVVKDLTKDQTSELIKERLSEYIVNPDVTVKISGYNSKVVYVVGEVGKPGKIFMRGNTITVREALLEAGLPLLSGVTKKSSLITPSENGNISKESVNVYALLYEGDLRENKTMNPGDVLYIPPTFLTKTMRAISPITQPISNTAGTAGSVAGAGGI